MVDTSIPPTVDTPVDASEAETTVAAKNFILQIILVSSAIVAVLGLPATSWLARAVAFFKSDQALPIVALLASAGSSGTILWRVVKKHRKLQTLSFLLPQSVAKEPANPSAAVAAAVEKATVMLDRRGVAPTRGL